MFHNIFLYVGVAFLMTHELDAVMHNEWLVLPITSGLPPAVGYQVFLWLHVPLFALIVSFLSTQSQRVRNKTAKFISSFLIIHAFLHLLFSGHKHYDFHSLSSNALIWGGAVFGLMFFGSAAFSFKDQNKSSPYSEPQD